MGRGYRRHNVQGRFRRGRVSGHTVAALNVPLNRSRSACGIAKWFTSINIHTDNYNSVTCDTLGAVPVVCENVEYRGNAPTSSFFEIQSELKVRLPDLLDFEEVVQGIRQYEGLWQACYPGIHAYLLASPVFNRQGDLLFELRPHGQWNAPPRPSFRIKQIPKNPKETSTEQQSGGQAGNSRAEQKLEKLEGENGTSSSEEDVLES